MGGGGCMGTSVGPWTTCILVDDQFIWAYCVWVTQPCLIGIECAWGGGGFEKNGKHLLPISEFVSIKLHALCACLITEISMNSDTVIPYNRALF